MGEPTPDRVMAVVSALGGREVWRSRYVPGLVFFEVQAEVADMARDVLSVLPDVRRVERDARAHAASTPNDPEWPNQIPHFERIKMSCAWDLRTSAFHIVGHVDTGVAYDVTDLGKNVLDNEPENEGVTGSDDDSNGIIDDLYGCEFLVEGDPDSTSDPSTPHNTPLDVSGHGSAAMSIFASYGNSGEGMAGIAWTIPVIPAKFIGHEGGRASDAIMCIEYCLTRKATIINCSWYVTSQIGALSDLIEYGPGVLYVAAAGFLGCNMDAGDPECPPFYPAAFPHPNIISVGSCWSDDSDAFYFGGSNWGPVSVDVIAPAQDIRVYNVQTGQYDNSGGGTSDAAAMVTGVAALVWSQFPGMTPSDVRQQIINTVDQKPQFLGKCVSGGRINAASALGLTCSP